MTSNNPNPNPKLKIITKVIVPIVVAVVGAGGFWQILPLILPKVFEPKTCKIDVSELTVDRKLIETKQSMKVSIRADNPDGKPILYSWQAVHGQMNPSIRSGSPEATYTAPSKGVDDTISVDITLPNCKSERRSQPISVIISSSSASPPTVLTPLTPSKNSSPSTIININPQPSNIFNPSTTKDINPVIINEPDPKLLNPIYPVFSGVCRDPWVTKAVSQVTGKPPKGQDDRGECNIRLYGNGRWSSYEDLVKKVKEAFASFTPEVCRDPWVTKAVSQVTGRPPKGYGEVGECDMYLYSNGSWSDYSILLSKVRDTLPK